MRLRHLILSLIVFAATIALTLPTTATAHSEAITECRDNIIYEEAVLVDSWVQQGTGFWAEGYDTTGSGEFDVLALSSITSIEKKLEGRVIAYSHNPKPVFWMVDRLEFDDDGDGLPDRVENDGTPDYIFVDPKGEGKCSDIRLYQDLTMPRNPGADALGKGEVVI